MSNEKSTDEQKKIVEVKNVATDTKKVVDIIIPEEEEKVDNIIKLSQTYNFEGEHISEVDLTNLENLNALQMQDIEKLYRKIAKSASSTPELTIEYAMATASKLTDLPLEFYQRISGKDITKIKFFIQRGLTAESIRKLCVNLGMATNTSIEFMFQRPQQELLDIADDLSERAERIERLRKQRR